MFFDEEPGAASAAELTRQTLIDTQERLGVMMDVMPMGLLIHTQQGALYANREAARVLGSQQDDMVGRHFLDFLETKVEDAREQMEAAFAGGGEVKTTEATVKAADGSLRTIRIIAGALPWQGTPVIQLLLQDITDLKLIQQKLEKLSYTDELTGLFNRRHAIAVAKEWMNDCTDGFAVILLDLDKFKSVNDRYGHAGGDLALQTLARVAVAACNDAREAETVLARIGGEEFMILRRSTDVSKAAQFTEELRTKIEAARIEGPTGPFSITASFGISIRATEHCSFDEMLSEADAALYEAKASGRNCIRVAIPPIKEALVAR